MNSTDRPKTRTSASMRSEIQASSDSIKDLALRFNISEQTVRKWKRRSDTADRSHQIRTRLNTLSLQEEVLIADLRRFVRFPLDDLLAFTQTFINQAASRSGLDRCLRRLQLSNLETLPLQMDINALPIEINQAEQPGNLFILHIPAQSAAVIDKQLELFIGIDRLTHWAFAQSYIVKNGHGNASHFLHYLQKAAPIKIKKVVTVRSRHFLEESANESQESIGLHPFQKVCRTLGITHESYSPFGANKTLDANEKLEGNCANQLLELAQSKALLLSTVETYNYQTPQRSLRKRPPIQALVDFRERTPIAFRSEFFVSGAKKRKTIDCFSCRNYLTNVGAYVFLELEWLLGRSCSKSQYAVLANSIRDTILNKTPTSLSGTLRLSNLRKKKLSAQEILRRKNEEEPLTEPTNPMVNALSKYQNTKGTPHSKVKSKALIKKPQLIDWTRTSSPKLLQQAAPNADREYFIVHHVLKYKPDPASPKEDTVFDLILIVERTSGTIFHHLVERSKVNDVSQNVFWYAIQRADEQLNKLQPESDNHPLIRNIYFPVGGLGTPRNLFIASLFETFEVARRIGKLKYKWLSIKHKVLDCNHWFVGAYHGRPTYPIKTDTDNIMDLRRIFDRFRGELSKAPKAILRQGRKLTWSKLGTLRVKKNLTMEERRELAIARRMFAKPHENEKITH